nr:hypothetical protein Iba_chr14dCG2920 [Ipomoea batatas]
MWLAQTMNLKIGGDSEEDDQEDTIASNWKLFEYRRVGQCCLLENLEGLYSEEEQKTSRYLGLKTGFYNDMMMRSRPIGGRFGMMRYINSKILSHKKNIVMMKPFKSSAQREKNEAIREVDESSDGAALKEAAEEALVGGDRQS